MLSQTLKQLRADRHMSQAELATMLGITQQAVARWERDKSTPDADTLKKLADFFDVSADYLLGRDSAEKTPMYRLKNDETKLIDVYRGLDTPKRQAVITLLAGLTSSRPVITSEVRAVGVGTMKKNRSMKKLSTVKSSRLDVM